MCRSIKVLRRPEAAATPAEISAAALQFVRKISGFHAPSKSNQPAFDAAVHDIAETTQRLLEAVRKPEAVRKKDTLRNEKATHDHH
ncbi:MAG: DUF2277 domain-containing protein [Bryobacteraceae bacterium]|jgi:hypothetical protein